MKLIIRVLGILFLKTYYILSDKNLRSIDDPSFESTCLTDLGQTFYFPFSTSWKSTTIPGLSSPSVYNNNNCLAHYNGDIGWCWDNYGVPTSGSCCAAIINGGNLSQKVYNLNPGLCTLSWMMNNGYSLQSDFKASVTYGGSTQIILYIPLGQISNGWASYSASWNQQEISDVLISLFVDSIAGINSALFIDDVGLSGACTLIPPSMIPTVYPSASPTCIANLCQTGKYATGNSTCVSCPIGKYTSQSDQTSCSSCSSGKYNNQESPGSTTTCLPCPAGTYANSYIGATACTPCTSGRYSAIGATSCNLCHFGQYAPSEGFTACNPCLPGTYSSTGESTCKECPGHTTSIGFAQNCSLCS